jgi:hypothetical protein
MKPVFLLQVERSGITDQRIELSSLLPATRTFDLTLADITSIR